VTVMNSSMSIHYISTNNEMTLAPDAKPCQGTIGTGRAKLRQSGRSCGTGCEESCYKQALSFSI
jgi:hypothetical protein